MNSLVPELCLRQGAVRSLLLLLASLSLMACADTREVYIRRPIPGGVGYWVERIVVPKEPHASRAPKVAQGTQLPPGKEKEKEEGHRSWLSFLFGPRRPSTLPPKEEGQWYGDSMSGSPRMVIRLGEQKVYFYKDNQLAGVSPISSGREGMATRAGSFSVIEKDRDHSSSWFGDYVSKDGTVLKREIDVRKDARPPGALFDAARMPFFMRITGAIGMHEGYLPGYPASHGCIRLPHRMAEIFYHNSSVGTPVKIVH